MNQAEPVYVIVHKRDVIRDESDPRQGSQLAEATTVTPSTQAHPTPGVATMGWKPGRRQPKGRAKALQQIDPPLTSQCGSTCGADDQGCP